MLDQVKSEPPPFAGEAAAATLLARLEHPAILLLDNEAFIRLWNRGAEALYGWTAEQALGRRITWLSARNGDPSLARSELAAVRLGGGGERVELRRRANGALMKVVVRKLADPHGDGVWELSEVEGEAGAANRYSLLGVAELCGAEVAVFDSGGRLVECSPLDLRERLTEPVLESARSLALRALRTGDACEEPGSASIPWLRACPIARDRGDSAIVLVRSGISAGRCGETELHRLTTLCRSLFDAQEAERRRLARELHDDLGQSLTGLLYALESETSPREQLRQQAATLLAKVRRLSQGLRPGILDDLGLAAALRWLADEHRRRTGTEVTVDVPSANERWPAELETALFRIAQQALTNATRHGLPNRIEISVSKCNGGLRMEIRDDGKGFDAESVIGQSTGLASMRERALLLGGRFELISAPGRGTHIEVSLPLLEGSSP